MENEFRREVFVLKPTSKEEKEKGKLRVAAYCRVSTDSEDQVHSFIAQVKYYTDFIRGREDMVLVEVYADEGITGTTTKKRDEFNRMMRDCRAGKVDRIYVKSVSRFARNTLDCIEYVRELKKLGVSVFFESDGIDTESMNHELVLYIKSAFAQEESLSNSKRVRRSNQMRMETGTFTFLNAPFGFRIEDDTLIPIPEEAKVVRQIFRYYLQGMGFGKIAQELNGQDVPGKPWGKERIKYILSNEKYIGDTLHQKTYTPEELPFRNRRNRGEVDQYYVSNSHEAVLDKDTFAAVQEMLKKNLEKEALKAAPKKYFFSGKIFCVDCGWAYKRRVQNDIVYWVCSKSGTAGQRCCTHPLSEEVIGKTFCNMYNKLRQHENELLKSTLTRLVELKAAVTKSRSEVIDIDEELVKIADRLAFYTEQYEAGVIDDGIYNDRTIADRKKISELRTRRNKLLTDDEDEQCIDELRQLILYLESQPKAILSFNENIFDGVVERVTVEEDKLCFEIKSGILLKEVIAWN